MTARSSRSIELDNRAHLGAVAEAASFRGAATDARRAAQVRVSSALGLLRDKRVRCPVSAASDLGATPGPLGKPDR